MPDHHARHHLDALKRAALAAFIEAANAIPVAGPLLAGAGAFVQELGQAKRDFPDPVQEAFQAMAQDFQTFLEAEARQQGAKPLDLAVQETLVLLDRHGLSPQELVATGLDSTKATQRTLAAGEELLQPLERAVEELVERLVTEYYRVLLSHQGALEHVGVEALASLLAKSSRLEEILAWLGEKERRNALAQARWPVRPYRERELHPYMLRPEYRLAPYMGQAHGQALADLVAWAQGLGEGGAPPSPSPWAQATRSARACPWAWPM